MYWMFSPPAGGITMHPSLGFIPLTMNCDYTELLDCSNGGEARTPLRDEQHIPDK